MHGTTIKKCVRPFIRNKTRQNYIERFLAESKRRKPIRKTKIKMAITWENVMPRK